MKIVFKDRYEAGQFLAQKLMQYAYRPDVIVLGLPRGGIPVAYEVAQALQVPLDTFIVRKLGVPGSEELAMGAIAMGGVRLLNPELIQGLDISTQQIDTVISYELEELKRRERLYRGGLPLPSLRDQIVILVDDGLATGASMWAAVVALQKLEPARIVVAVPVAAEETCAFFREHVDEIVCGITPDPFRAVGLWYEDFSQTTDEEVHELLQRAKQPTFTR